MHRLSNEEKGNWIQDDVERSTAEARQPVADAEVATRQQQENTGTAENAELTTREPEKMIEEMMVPIGDSLSDLASSDNGEDGEDEDDEETEQGNLSEDDKPAWVMGTISKTVQQRMETYQQKRMKLDELTQPGWWDAAGNFCERDKKHGVSESMVPADLTLQTDDFPAAPAPTTFGEQMECLDIVPGISQMPQGTSWLASSHIRLGSVKPRLDTDIAGLAPAPEPD